ncbi:MAG: electron transport complex subunit RsxA [Pseudomonadota bacterium]
MSNALLLLLATALINNVILVQFLGLCPYLGVSRQLSAAWGMSLATGVVLVVAAVLSFIIEHTLLIPFGLTQLRTLAFILIIASTVQAIEIVMARTSPLIYNALGLYLPLITTNCAVLGVALLTARTTQTLLEALIYGFGTAVGFGLVLCLFAAMREYLDELAIPRLWRGAPIALVTAGLMALGFLGLAGLDRGFGA